MNIFGEVLQAKCLLSKENMYFPLHNWKSEIFIENYSILRKRD